MFGVTAALYGEITLRDGRVEQANFESYQMLRMKEAPAVEVYIVPSLEPPGGMGEPGTSAIVPAITTAVFAATGKLAQAADRHLRVAAAVMNGTPRGATSNASRQRGPTWSSPPARPGRFQIGPPRGYRLEALPGGPAVGPPRRRCRSALGARPPRDHGQSALRRETDAPPTPGGPNPYSHVRRLPHRAWAIGSTATG
jgi:hypothetical protein